MKCLPEYSSETESESLLSMKPMANVSIYTQQPLNDN